MDTVHVKCPHCNSEYEIAVNKPVVFCMDCGSQIIVDHHNNEYTVNYNRNTNDNYTYRKIDDARIREADVKESIRLRELEIEENAKIRESEARAQLRLQEVEAELETEKRKYRSKKLKYIVIAVCIALFIIYRAIDSYYFWVLN